jgi:DNA polymerase-3 subunit alpha
MSGFVHLHVHSQYSILDGACHIHDLIERAIELGMPGVAVTDHGNLFGIMEFHEAARKKEGFKPIIGCETYVARRSRKDKTDPVDRKGDHLILLVKNLTGYKNLVKLISLSWIEGHYYKPRIDKELLLQYHEGLMVSTACLAGEIPRAILAGNMTKAEQAFIWYKDLFGEDFYLELMRHPVTTPDRDESVYQRQMLAGEGLVKLSKKFGVKLLATNDVHFLDPGDAEAHDRLLCINTGKVMSDKDRLRYTGQEWFKTERQMTSLFADYPESIEHTLEVLDKAESFSLFRDPIMPDFPIPDGFSDANTYLRHLTYEGAKKRYSDLTPEIAERIDFELDTIRRMGYPGYFLIIQDVLHAAREMGVSVGPGRGSAAGSVVSYCIRITDIDPIRYNLLFERFLNPDRVSLPDIDIDFDEEGRDKVLQWVVDKYGYDKVAHVITFGTMAAKAAIRDVARVHEVHIDEVNHLTKLVPGRPGITLREAYEEVTELKAAKLSSNKVISETLRVAELLEGSIRQTGIHACGIIIGKDTLTDHIPVTSTKESKLLITQYEGQHIEKVGMLKMDFLGLKTLAIINDALKIIRQSKGVDLDIENIPLDDPLTYELFSKGRSTGIFQFESPGMKKYLRELKPNRIEDLIAMNALYRPGPMVHIPRYINRKHGREKIEYDIPVMEKYLKDTYGITVYQEQVMLLSQELGGFTKGEADTMRKAMGKKIGTMMDDLGPKFFEGCKKNNYDATIVAKIWDNWESFAKYAFNKSHSACYAYVAYRQAYLKAHYPAEFMAAVLSRNLSDLKEITNFLEECKRMEIPVLGPDVNESELTFVVNKKEEIRFGMAGIKNVGEAAVKNIIEERKRNGPFVNIFDLTRRISPHIVNKRCLESLVKAGAFDCFEHSHRAQYFFQEHTDDPIFLEKVVRHASDYHARKESMQQSLFAGMEEVQLREPQLPDCRPWNRLEQLQFEKEVTGFYLSGHPLDDYHDELKHFCTVTIEELKSNLESFRHKEVTFGGIMIEAAHKTNHNGKPFGTFVVEDYLDFITLFVFSEDFMKWKYLIEEGNYVLIRAKVETRYNDPKSLVIRVQEINLLSDVMEKFSKNMILTINLNMLQEGIIGSIHDLVKKYAGKCTVKFRIVDETDNLFIDLPAKKLKINPKEFYTALKSFPEIMVRITS